MRRYNTIGVKLVAAFAGSTLLLTLVCVIAWMTWSQLDLRVSGLLDESVPRYNASYLLESKSSEVRRKISQIERVTSKVQLDNHLLSLGKQLSDTKQIVERVQRADEATHDSLSALAESYTSLASSIDLYGYLVSKRIDAQRKIDLLKEQLDWIHQDIRTELMPLRQEIDWQISRNQKQAKTDALLKQLNVIQQVLDLESTIYELALDVVSATQLGHVNNGMKVIQYRTEELHRLSQPIFEWPSSIAYQQLVGELTTLLQIEGFLHQQLLDYVSIRERIEVQQRDIDRQIGTIHNQIGGIVASADQAFYEVKQDTTEMVNVGNRVLLICFAVSILTSLILAYYFIYQRIVARLANLSNSIDAIINDDLHHPIRVDGNDEIGRLSAKLIEYGDKVKEMQRTNALSLINNTSASLMTVSLGGWVESANVSARRLLDLDDAITELPIWSAFPEHWFEALRAQFDTDSALMRECRSELTMSLADDPYGRFLHCEFSLFTHGHCEKVIITITDVTEQIQANRILEQRVAEKTRDVTERNRQLKLEIQERQKAESHLKKTQSELIQAAKMAVVGQAMTSLAHELNQPLNAMSTYLYSANLFNQKADSEQVATSLTHIESLKERMSKIVNGLRHFAKKSDGEPTSASIELHDVAEHSMLLVNTRAKRQQIQIRNQLDKTLMVQGSLVAYEQVLINLMVNSCDALSEANGAERVIELCHLYSTQTHHAIAVCDNGKGFASDIVDRLFTPFTTTKEIGLGLGMNICKSIIEKYNGNIYLASNAKGGAMVVLEMPHDD
ncbi:HAMP domain-containing protein [Vibrio vulnificus]|uniref:ATP-binding protein n=1 Tax=Vibrio vulnificus TaxID=672 RepID=UPI00102A31AE|nr:ATP-binding protein [Vibrio vulnificus]EHU9442798.1 HAMP domain-containing protein [Vibrio vulnificus]RZQ04125.1 HAMP domain-containing protein [Vibrio vulnificus]